MLIVFYVHLGPHDVRLVLDAVGVLLLFCCSITLWLYVCHVLSFFSYYVLWACTREKLPLAVTKGHGSLTRLGYCEVQAHYHHIHENSGERPANNNTLKRQNHYNRYTVYTIQYTQQYQSKYYDTSNYTIIQAIIQ